MNVIAAPPTLSELTRASLRVGCLGFGGPAGQIALMRRVFVEEKKWIEEEEYAHGLSFCMLLPGPEAQQLATYVGWRLHGFWGGVIAGWLFVLPGAAIVFALSWLYAAAGTLPEVSALFFGIKCAVVALVVEALIKVGRRALAGRGSLAIAVAAFVALLWGAPFPVVIIAAGVVGALRGGSPLAAPLRAARNDGEGMEGDGPAGRRRSAAWLLWLALWLVPLGAAALALGPGHVLVQVGALFSVLACVTFGGAYALLAYLSTEAAARGWLTPAQMIDGLGLAETTPGPLILVNQFVGFMAGWEGGLMLAAACAAMASWCTFAPSFVWIFAGAGHVERLRAAPRARAALGAITAAVLGVIAKLALFFAVHVLFREQASWTPPGAFAPLDVPIPGSANWAAIGLSAAAALALIRLKAPLLWVLAACAGAGFLLARGGLA